MEEGEEFSRYALCWDIADDLLTNALHYTGRQCMRLAPLRLATIVLLLRSTASQLRCCKHCFPVSASIIPTIALSSSLLRSKPRVYYLHRSGCPTSCIKPDPTTGQVSSWCPPAPPSSRILPDVSPWAYLYLYPILRIRPHIPPTYQIPWVALVLTDLVSDPTLSHGALCKYPYLVFSYRRPLSFHCSNPEPPS